MTSSVFNSHFHTQRCAVTLWLTATAAVDVAAPLAVRWQAKERRNTGPRCTLTQSWRRLVHRMPVSSVITILYGSSRIWSATVDGRCIQTVQICRLAIRRASVADSIKRNGRNLAAVAAVKRRQCPADTKIRMATTAAFAFRCENAVIETRCGTYGRFDVNWHTAETTSYWGSAQVLDASGDSILRCRHTVTVIA